MSYDNAYADNNVYGHVVDLIDKARSVPGGIHLDFGCGFGRMAEIVRDRLGLRYIGLDVGEDGLNSLKARGFDTMFVDLRDPVAAFEQIERYLPIDVPIASISIVDTLEHMGEPEKAIGMFWRFAQKHACPLIVSVPNFAHRDIGLRLAFGAFDYTQSGLLDHTHLKYFTERQLSALMSGEGWHQIAANDVTMTRSDQSFPRDHAALSPSTPLHQLLSGLRVQAEDNGTVNQFVRMYLSGRRTGRVEPLDSIAECRGNDEIFLTVLTRTQGRRIDTLRETLLCLSAQTNQDFEVCVIGHDLDVDCQLAVEHVIAETHDGMRSRIRLLLVEGGTRADPLNAGFEASRGRYVAILDDDDLVAGNWVEVFAQLCKENGGQLLRSVAVAQSWDKIRLARGGVAARAVGGMQAIYPETFNLLMHLTENRSPLHSLAFPRSLYRDLRFRFDPQLTTAEDWDFIVRVAPIAGVAVSTDITCIYRRWVNAENSSTVHDQNEWRTNYLHTLRKIDAQPLLLPAGYSRIIRETLYEIDRLRGDFTTPQMPHFDPASLSETQEQARYLEAVRWRYHELIHSLSWRLTHPLRAIISRLSGLGPMPAPSRLWQLSARDLEHLIRQIENSRSWRMTSGLRNFRRKVRQ